MFENWIREFDLGIKFENCSLVVFQCPGARKPGDPEFRPYTLHMLGTEANAGTTIYNRSNAAVLQ